MHEAGRVLWVFFCLFVCFCLFIFLSERNTSEILNKHPILQALSSSWELCLECLQDQFREYVRKMEKKRRERDWKGFCGYRDILSQTMLSIFSSLRKVQLWLQKKRFKRKHAPRCSVCWHTSLLIWVNVCFKSQVRENSQEWRYMHCFFLCAFLLSFAQIHTGRYTEPSKFHSG